MFKKTLFALTLASASTLSFAQEAAEYEVHVSCRDASRHSVTRVVVLEYAPDTLNDVTVTISGDTVHENATDGTVIGEIMQKQRDAYTI